jgi:hypothetical protein
VGDVAGSTAQGIGISAGWSTAASLNGVASPTVTPAVSIFFKVATGGDAAPTLTLTSGNSLQALLAEFTGNATNPLVDATNTNHDTKSPVTGQTSSIDRATGELVVCVSMAIFSATGANAVGQSLNNAPLTSLANGGAGGGTGATNDQAAYDSGVTTTNASVDTLTTTATPASGKTLTAASCALASFRLPIPAPWSPVWGTNFC